MTEQVPDTREISYEQIPHRELSEIFRENELVGVGEGYLVVSPKPSATLADLAGVNYNELGTSGTTIYGRYSHDDYNPDLVGLRGLQKYDQMRKGDARVSSSLLLRKTPILGARWFIEPASDSVRDKNVAERLWKNINDEMTISWTQVLWESMLSLDFGFYAFEKVWEPKYVDGEWRICLRKLAPRHPMNVTEWDYDANGGPNGVFFGAPESLPRRPDVYIPIDKLLIFTHQREGGNMAGVSALRSAYKHWYFKDNLYKIDAIQKERHGIGIPIIHLPPNFNTEDAQLANQIGRNLRVNEKSHVVLPPLWNIEWADIKGQPVDAIPSIEHHDRMISANVLTEFATGDNDRAIELYFRTAAVIADTVKDCLNLYLARQYVDYNYSRVGYPKFNYWFVPNLRDLSFALRNLVGADLIRPDQGVEDLLREIGHLPEYEKGSDRVLELRRWEKSMMQAAPVTTPGQLPNNKPQAGLPRQSAKPPVGTGSNRTGGPTNNSA